MRLFLTTILLMLSAHVCAAQTAVSKDSSVQALRAECKMPPGHADFARCIHYVAGVADMLALVGSSSKGSEVRQMLGKCGSGSYGAYVQAFINWADQHPEKWGEHRSFGVAYALTEKWPCR